MNRAILAFLLPLPHGSQDPAAMPIPVIVDADTANEIDDLYAIVRALREPRFRVVGLTSAQWHGPRKDKGDTAAQSQRLNEEILRRMGLEGIPHPRRVHEPGLGDPAGAPDRPAGPCPRHRALKYEPSGRGWSKDEFNANNDRHAVDPEGMRKDFWRVLFQGIPPGP